MIHEIILDEKAALGERGTSIVFDLAGSAPGPISLGIALLNEALVESLMLRTRGGCWGVRLRKGLKAREIRFRRYGNQRIEVVLGPIELERWLIFFLKYYRDNSAEVDHLDVDGEWEDGVSCGLALKVSLSAPSVSEAEARSRLGM